MSIKRNRLVICDLDQLFDSHQDDQYADGFCQRPLCQAIEQVDSLYLLQWLSEHKCDSVRGALAASAKLPDQVIWTLASDRSLRVRYQLAGNVNLADFVLECLAEDEEDLVAQRATKTLRQRAAKANNLIFGFFSANPPRKTG